MSTRLERVLNLVVNGGVMVAAVVVLAHPRGPLRPRLAEWRETRAVGAELTRQWPALVSGSAQIGDTDTTRVLVVFSDYQCPACRQSEARLPVLMAENQFTVVYRHLPIPQLHPHAEDAAKAAICAENQGRFRNMHEYLFTDRSWKSRPDWTAIARAAEIPDSEAFSACLEDERTAERLARDVEFARALRLTATPSFVGPARVRAGIPTPDEIASLLDTR